MMWMIAVVPPPLTTLMVMTKACFYAFAPQGKAVLRSICPSSLSTNLTRVVQYGPNVIDLLLLALYVSTISRYC